MEKKKSYPFNRVALHKAIGELRMPIDSLMDDLRGRFGCMMGVAAKFRETVDADRNQRVSTRSIGDSDSDAARQHNPYFHRLCGALIFFFQAEDGIRDA